MRRSERGVTGVGIVFGVAALVVVVLVVLYFASDVFRTKAGTAYRVGRGSEPLGPMSSAGPARN